ncbi:MAG TPA: LLM class F420-dependent oxidoreductase [Candidatus Binatia bacterium]|jgi:probable F420-dependent oxidoreductase|nr:LLM class F420-dependent oxidoreductase [Candidatus Binatia bacterium]
MDYGLHLAVSDPRVKPEDLIHFVKRAEELDFFCVTVADHIVIPRNIASPYPYTVDKKYPGKGHHLDQMTVMAFLASATQRISFVASVMIAPYRPPVVVAKMLSTLDFLSGGRVILGLGVGWMKEEFLLVGAPPFEDRGRVTDEYIKAFKELWTKENPTFKGTYCKFSDLAFLPKPAQKPHIPIWIGGHSNRALRRAAELGDGWHPIGGVPTVPLEPADLERKLETLAEYAQAAGRNPSEIRVAFKASLFDREVEAQAGRRRRFIGSAGQVASDVRDYQKAGVNCLIFDVRSPGPAETLKRLDWLAQEVLPMV